MKMVGKFGLGLALFVSVSGWARASVVEKPVVMQDAMVCVTVSDLHGFIDGVGEVAAQVNPAISGMMIKSQLGIMLGDPGLSGIAPGKGLAVVAMDQTNVFAVIEINEAQAATYSAALLQQGVQSRFIEGVLVVAPDEVQLAKGAGLVVAVKETQLAKRTPSLRVAAPLAGLLEKNKTQIDGMMQMMPMMIGMGMAQSAPDMDPETAQSTLRILQAELQVLLSLAGQCEIAEIVLLPKDGSLQIKETYMARPGTRLATLLNSPKINQPNPKIQSGLVGKAAIALDCTMANPEALTLFFGEEMGVLLEVLGLQSADVAGWNQMMKTSMSFYGGSFSETIDFGGDKFMDICCIMDVKDEAAALEYYKTSIADMAPVLKLYKNLGMEMSMDFKENVREHAGVNIHQYKISLKMSEEQMAALTSMNMDFGNMDCDIAVCDGLMLCAMGDTKVETLIDRVKNGDFTVEPLKARSVYPADGFFYCDIDVARYMSGIASIMPKDPNNPLPQIAAMLQGSEPVTSAGFRENGMVMCSANIPGSLLGRIGQAVMVMQMQKMQQGAAPQAMPMETPDVGMGAVPAATP